MSFKKKFDRHAQFSFDIKIKFNIRGNKNEKVGVTEW